MKSSLSSISTRIEITVTMQAAPDLLDPITRRIVIPESVVVCLSRSENQEWAHVSVHGPRRLKSGGCGVAIDSAGWEKAVRAPLHRPSVDRPQWLTDVLAQYLPSDWPTQLLDLPGGAA
ncbi:hypothetical protein ABZ383_27415 [Streptomyces sp. NPDC005900]|uniref:hypothetical protein n=1 Tax=Streptomyces sp. NPDC005900 TaxID=3154569 RepID=UPI0033D0E634